MTLSDEEAHQLATIITCTTQDPQQTQETISDYSTRQLDILPVLMDVLGDAAQILEDILERGETMDVSDVDDESQEEAEEDEEEEGGEGGVFLEHQREGTHGHMGTELTSGGARSSPSGAGPGAPQATRPVLVRRNAMYVPAGEVPDTAADEREETSNKKI